MNIDVLLIIFIGALIAGMAFAQHMDKIRDQAHLDRMVIIAKWKKYSDLRISYSFGTESITPVEDLNEAEQELRKAAQWYNKKYKKYGYCCPPELLFDLEVE